ncbi:hypothetical protein Z045_05670 [Rhodococcus pyridinivorans KG-16]|uniref:Siphovirus-type tail component C-terminal domain-containing protein n=1 Tax=Rhodococcus pyridinivorans KG-16 TaxID=1441730 RepID=A0A0V9UNS1_9NOCA|nr:phage tail domain-containing protein [Rhodococcus pyridinivorans]KSZ59659.1 hypothetical protein Z045_05670 [Rhodococcus pyridinivorans KG-16]
MSAIPVTYGPYSLQTTNVRTTRTNVFSAPRNNIQADKLAESDGAVIVKAQLEPKIFTVEGILRTDSIEATQHLMDQFKAALSVPNQALDIQYAGDTRRFISTAQNIMLSNDRGLASAGFSVEFLCPSGVGTDTYASTLLAPTAITTSTASLGVNIGGTYQAEPTIVLTINTLTGGTNKTVTVTNDVTRRGVAVTRDWAAGDKLEIDTLGKRIYVNNIPMDFIGQFPVWEPGPGSIGVMDDFGARDATVNVEYVRRWL